MPRWIWILVIADLVAAVALALAMAWVSQSGRFWPTLRRATVMLGICFVLGSFLIYFGGWLLVRGLTGG